MSPLVTALMNWQGEFREGLRCGSGFLVVREGGGLFGTWEERETCDAYKACVSSEWVWVGPICCV